MASVVDGVADVADGFAAIDVAATDAIDVAATDAVAGAVAGDGVEKNENLPFDISHFPESISFTSNIASFQYVCTNQCCAPVCDCSQDVD